jgi:membrane-bound lytic murein transglycosylase MltF
LSAPRLRVAVLFALVMAVSASASAQQTVSDRYDHVFKKYTKRFFGPGYDWRIFKAQAMTESNLDASARNRVGARGLMQLMPTTFKEVQSKNPEVGSIDDPEWNIAAGVYYDRQLWRQLSESRGLVDRRRFMFASYNAGRGTVRRAQNVAESKALDPMVWPSIPAVAPEVPNWRHEETLQYVSRIEDAMGRMDTAGRVRQGSSK